MGPKRTSAIAIQPDKHDLRSQAGFGVGVLLAAFGAQTWAGSAILPNPRIEMAADSASFGGALVALTFLAAAMVVGWICGGWILKSEDRTASGNPLGSFLRQLIVVAGLLLAGIALGSWPLAGGLILIAGAAAGALARLGWEGFQFLSENC